MKKMKLLLLLMLSIFALTACGGTTTSSDDSNAGVMLPENSVELGNDDYGYVYLVGTRWEENLEKLDDTGMLGFLAEDGTFVYFGSNESTNTTKEDLISACSQYYTTTLTSEDLTVDENASFQTLPATLVSGTFVDPELNETLAYRVWFFEDEGFVRYMAIDAKPDEMDALAKEVEDTYSRVSLLTGN